ncbi:MAG: hypothetical protein V4436_02355 [Patescibacteria group bacterium]
MLHFIPDRTAVEKDVCLALFNMREKGLSVSEDTLAQEAHCKPDTVARLLAEDHSLLALFQSVKLHSNMIII